MRFFLQIVSGLLLQKGKRRISMAFLGVTVSALLLTLLLNISLEIRGQAEKILSRFGPNLILSPKTEPLSSSVSGVSLGSGEKENINFPQNILEKIKEVDSSKAIQTIVSRQRNQIALRVKGDLKSIHAFSDKLMRALPSVQASIPLERTQAESDILQKTHTLILISSIIVSLAAMLCVGSTLFAIVLERRREIGLMKALGARPKNILQIFLAESSLVGLFSGFIGWGIGAGLAEWVGQVIFHVSLPFHPSLLLWVILLSWFTTLLASLLPIQAALSIEPIQTLRGE